MQNELLEMQHEPRLVPLLSAKYACTGVMPPCSNRPSKSSERTLAENNDACIDSAKAIVEVVSQIYFKIRPYLNSMRPAEKLPTFGAWLSATVRALKLGDVRHTGFQKLISQHKKLTDALGELRNDAGTAATGEKASSRNYLSIIAAQPYYPRMQ